MSKKPRVCQCDKGMCAAPRPEWCIGRRHADGYRAFRDRVYVLVFNGNEISWNPSERQCWDWAVFNHLAEWIDEGEGIVKVRDDYDLKVVVRE